MCACVEGNGNGNSNGNGNGVGGPASQPQGSATASGVMALGLTHPPDGRPHPRPPALVCPSPFVLKMSWSRRAARASECMPCEDDVEPQCGGCCRRSFVASHQFSLCLSKFRPTPPPPASFYSQVTFPHPSIRISISCDDDSEACWWFVTNFQAGVRAMRVHDPPTEMASNCKS